MHLAARMFAVPHFMVGPARWGSGAPLGRGGNRFVVMADAEGLRSEGKRKGKNGKWKSWLDDVKIASWIGLLLMHTF